MSGNPLIPYGMYGIESYCFGVYHARSFKTVLGAIKDTYDHSRFIRTLS